MVTVVFGGFAVVVPVVVLGFEWQFVQVPRGGCGATAVWVPVVGVDAVEPLVLAGFAAVVEPVEEPVVARGALEWQVVQVPRGP